VKKKKLKKELKIYKYALRGACGGYLELHDGGYVPDDDMRIKESVQMRYAIAKQHVLHPKKWDSKKLDKKLKKINHKYNIEI
jgi:hypothetical protein